MPLPYPRCILLYSILVVNRWPTRGCSCRCCWCKCCCWNRFGGTVPVATVHLAHVADIVHVPGWLGIMAHSNGMLLNAHGGPALSVCLFSRQHGDRGEAVASRHLLILLYIRKPFSLRRPMSRVPLDWWRWSTELVVGGTKT